MHQIIQTKNGQETIKMIDTLPKCRNRLKELKDSNRGKKVSFRMEKSDQTVKFEAKPIGGEWKSGQYSQNPKVVK